MWQPGLNSLNVKHATKRNRKKIATIPPPQKKEKKKKVSKFFEWP
jgi:hypothetical protein